MLYSSHKTKHLSAGPLSQIAADNQRQTMKISRIYLISHIQDTIKKHTPFMNQQHAKHHDPQKMLVTVDY